MSKARQASQTTSLPHPSCASVCLSVRCPPSSSPSIAGSSFPDQDQQLQAAASKLLNEIKEMEQHISQLNPPLADAAQAFIAMRVELDQLRQQGPHRGPNVDRLLALQGNASGIEAFKLEIRATQQRLSQLLGEAEQRQGTCVICLERLPTVVFFPCLQRCICDPCWADMQRQQTPAEPLKCPACRGVSIHASNVDHIKTTS
mmetsp:Transcript_31782/g.78810  ORF Transcript_31782/g.78810 Transcript_31782/m.78810 type:complete len:202 (-) Transcript_31782:109-714(-)